MPRRARAGKQVTVLLAGTGIGVMLLLATVLTASRSKPSPSPPEIFRLALRQLQEMEDYDLVIEEKAPGYRLLFQGRVNRVEGLVGLLPDYDLEVQYRKGELLVKRAGAEQWEESAGKALQGLTGFLTTPEELLLHQQGNFHRAERGSTVELAGFPCQTVYLDITEDIALTASLFPDINPATIQSVHLGVALSEGDLNLKQIRVLVNYIDSEAKLERSYTGTWKVPGTKIN